MIRNPLTLPCPVGPSRRRRRQCLLGIALAASLTVGACSSSDTAAPQSTEAEDATGATAAPATTPITDASPAPTASSDVESDATRATSYPLTIEQEIGAITLDERPERVYVVDAWSYDLVSALGVTPVGAAMYSPPASWVDGALAVDDIHLITDGLPIEDIVASNPDLIIDGSGFFSSGDDETALLLEIAPLLTPPGDYLTVGWRDRLINIATVLDRAAEAEALLAEAESAIDELATGYPELAGASVSVARYTPGSSTFDIIVGATDFTRSFLDADLGFTTPAAQLDAIESGEFETIGGALSGVSLERADLVVDGADITIVFVAGDPAALTDQAIWQALPAVQDGRIYLIGFDGLIATRTPSPAAIRYFVDSVVPELALLLQP